MRWTRATRLTFLLVSGCFSRPELAMKDGGGSGSDGGVTCDFARAPGLVAYLPFDEVTGNQTPDLSPNGFTGTLNGSLALAPGHDGMAVSFTAAGQYVDLGSSSLVDDLSALTVCMWIRPSVAIGATIADKSMDGTHGGWNFYITAESNKHGLGFVQPQAVFMETPRVLASSGPWAHVCATWDGTLVSVAPIPGTHLYLDGSEILPDFVVSMPDTVRSDGPYPLHLGSNATGDFTYRGLMDDVLLFDRALSATEIASLHDCGP